MRIVASAILIILHTALALTQTFGGTSNCTPYVIVNDFSWLEFDDSGRVSENEDGSMVRYGLFLHLLPFPQNGLLIGLDVQYGFFDNVNYHGYLQRTSGTRTPYLTTSGYTEGEGTLQLGYRFNVASAIRITPTVGYGMGYWSRRLDNGGPNSYDEEFSFTSVSAGVDLSFAPEKNREIFLGGRVDFPSSFSESVKLRVRNQSDLSSINLLPDPDTRLTLEAGCSVSRLFFSVMYRQWTLEKSGLDYGYYQPASSRRDLSLKIGYSISLP